MPVRYILRFNTQCNNPNCTFWRYLFCVCIKSKHVYRFLISPQHFCSKYLTNFVSLGEKITASLLYVARTLNYSVPVATSSRVYAPFELKCLVCQCCCLYVSFPLLIISSNYGNRWGLGSKKRLPRKCIKFHLSQKLDEMY